MKLRPNLVAKFIAISTFLTVSNIATAADIGNATCDVSKLRLGVLVDPKTGFPSMSLNRWDQFGPEVGFSIPTIKPGNISFAATIIFAGPGVGNCIFRNEKGDDIVFGTHGKIGEDITYLPLYVPHSDQGSSTLHLAILSADGTGEPQYKNFVVKQ